MYSNVEAIFILAVLSTSLTVEVLSSSDILRLVDGPIPETGTAEMNVPDHGWIQICAESYDNWNSVIADVVCNSLGYPGAMRAGITDVESHVEGQKWVYNVTCTGQEASLDECSYDIVEQCSTAARPRCNYKGYMGCYYDNPFNKRPDVGPIKNGTMTIQYCLNWCRGQDMAYAELSRGRKCSCRREGNDYTDFTQTDGCNVGCAGDESQTCGGGGGRFEVYPTNVGSCGGHIIGGETIYSPGFPGNYKEMMDCTWIISSSSESTISLDIVFLQLAGDNDYLSIFDSTREIGYCNVSVCPPKRKIDSCSSSLSLVFHSEKSTSISQWLGIFEIVVSVNNLRCQPPSNVKNGTFALSGTCPYDYSINVLCDIGYILTTIYSTVSCNEEGKWNDILPGCIEFYIFRVGALVAIVCLLIVLPISSLIVALVVTVIHYRRKLRKMNKKCIHEMQNTGDYANVGAIRNGVQEPANEQNDNIQERQRTIDSDRQADYEAVMDDGSTNGNRSGENVNVANQDLELANDYTELSPDREKHIYQGLVKP
ncbi:kremen protein 1-like isoform X2 [Glandiceps talaboti]